MDHLDFRSGRIPASASHSLHQSLQSNFPSTPSGGSNPLLLRLRRYVHEIGDAVGKIADSSAEADELEREEAALVATEKQHTVPGLRRVLAQARLQILQLKHANTSLQEKAAEAESIPALQNRVEELTVERTRLVGSLDELRNTTDAAAEEQTTRFDELHSLFHSLSVQSEVNIETCEQRRLQIESLLSENESLKDKVQALESHLKAVTADYKSLLDAEHRRIQELSEMLTSSRNAAQESRDEFQREIKMLKDGHIEDLKKQRKNEMLESEIAKLKTVVSEKEDFIATNLKQPATLRMSLLDQSMPKKRKESDSSSTMMGSKRIELASRDRTDATDEERDGVLQQQNARLTQQLSSTQNEVRELKRLLTRWTEAASVLSRERAGVDISPSQVRVLLSSIDKWKVRAADEIQRLRAIESQLNVSLNNTEDELAKTSLELTRERELRTAAEIQMEVQSGALKSQKELIERFRQDDDTNLTDRTEPKELADHLNLFFKMFEKEKQNWLSLLKQAQSTIEESTLEKKKHLERAESIGVNFKKLETLMYEVQEEQESNSVFLKQQKHFIQSLQARLKTIETSSTYEYGEGLRRERDEAIRLTEVTKEFYTIEAITFRAILKVLFGWRIRIDMAPLGEDITITLRPGLRGASFEDDAALVFRVKAKSPTTSMKELPPNIIDAEIDRLYNDEDFSMHLDGRYVEKWEKDVNWKSQLSARCSYAAFIAVTTLAEQNIVLQKNALVTAAKLRKSRNAATVQGSTAVTNSNGGDTHNLEAQ